MKLILPWSLAIATIASGACDVAQVHVMTRNVYDGIDYHGRFPLGTQDFGTALRDTLADITLTDPDARAALHASQIAREHPDLLAIQEAVVVQQNGITQVDMLKALSIDLAKLGKPYEIIVKMKGLDTQSVHFGRGNTLSISIWDAILVRSDLPPHDRVVNDHKQGLYPLSYSLASLNFNGSDPDDLSQPHATMNFRRNWMFVDMQLRGHAFRFVTTHLDVPDVPTPQDQSAELLKVVGNTRLPVIVTGDFNDAYDKFPLLAAADYRDAWIGDNGATCCQDMNDLMSKRDKKIDLILLRGGVSATSAHLVGTIAAPCSEPCTHWASDHAGVVAGLVFTSAINSRLVWLLIAIGGVLLFAGLLLGVSRWLRRGR